MSVQFISTILAKSKDAIEIPRHIKEIVVLPMKANAIIAANGINKEPKMASQFLDELPIFLYILYPVRRAYLSLWTDIFNSLADFVINNSIIFCFLALKLC